jgi:uncharacterized protein
MELTPEQGRTLLNIAAGVIRVCLGGRAGFFEAFDDTSIRPSGCFATIHQKRTHALRGCVGRLGTREPLFQLIRTAAASALQDPRFANNPVTLAELDSLELELSLLSPLVRKATPLDFDLLNEGLFLQIEGRTGLFLPQVARQTGWTREQLLDRLCQEKLGVHAQSWRDPRAILHTFTCTIIGPEPMDPLGVESGSAKSPSSA